MRERRSCPRSRPAKGDTMGILKRAALVVAAVAMAVSVAPALGVFDPDPGGGGGGGGSNDPIWTVTCYYNMQMVLVRKTCISGGNMRCLCPGE